MAPSDWLPFLTVLADRADEIALRGFRKKGLRVEDKPDRSPVTDADRAIEETVRTVTRQRHPELGLLGEEQGASAGSSAARLIVDPIDATRNFVRGIPVFATLLAIEEGDEVVAGALTTPATTSSPSSIASSVANTGMPRTKLRVASMGSTIRRAAELPADAPCSSPSSPSSGCRWRVTVRTVSSIARSASVTGLRSGLSSTRSPFLRKPRSAISSARSARTVRNGSQSLGAM